MLRVSQNRILRRIFGPKRDEVTGGRIKLRNEERHELYSSPNIICVIKSRIMRWAGHVETWGRGEAYTEFWWGILRKRDHLENPDLKEDNIKIIFIMSDGGGSVWVALSWFRIRTSGGKWGNGPKGFIIHDEFPD